jgi:RNA polymerase sigma-70 factor, ECF subfamily
MDVSEEKKIIERARRDPEAFGKIFDEYHDAIFGYVLRRVGDAYASREITSETFFRALDRLWQFQWRNVSISSWLYRIATNEVNQHFRRKKRAPQSLDILFEEKGFEPSDESSLLLEAIEQERELARAGEWQRLRSEIERLPEKYQEVVTFRYFENKKISEIAGILGKKEGTVKSLLSRALAKLREKFMVSGVKPRNPEAGEAL